MEAATFGHWRAFGVNTGWVAITFLLLIFWILVLLQATVCMKQLAYSLLEMLLLATFPELHDLVLDVRSSVM